MVHALRSLGLEVEAVMLRQMSIAYERPFIGGQPRMQCFRAVLLKQGYLEPCLTATGDKVGKYVLTTL
jgi:hypothetical protein